jgi:DNA-binding SARP family transcriptional activator
MPTARRYRACMIRRAFLFGELRVAEGGGDTHALVTRTHDARRLFALLALSPLALRREKLGATLWPEVPDDVQRARLRYALSMLRRAVGEVAVVAVGSETLSLSDQVQTDIREFWDQVQTAVLAASAEARLHALQAALRLADVPLLAGWTDPWAVAERARLDACRHDVLRALVAELTAQGRPEEARLWQHLTVANASPTPAP